MPQTIIIPSWQKGGTLSQIAAQYGTTVAELQKANNITDPNKIREGATLIIPDKTTPPGSLGGTLPPATPPAGASGDPALPETPTDKLTSFNNLLQKISNKVTANTQMPSDMPGNVDFSKVSGGTMASILGVINNRQIDVQKEVTDLLDSQQKQATDIVKTLISTGGLLKLGDDQIKKLADTSPYSYEYLMGIKSSLTDEQTAKTTKTHKGLGGVSGGYVNTKTGESMTPFDAGKSIADANPDKSDAALFSAIKLNVPELSVTEINNIIKERTTATVTPESAKKIIIDTLKTQKDVYTRNEAEVAITTQLKSALGLKDADKLPKSYVSMIEDALVEIYGATFWQNVIPGGRGAW